MRFPIFFVCGKLLVVAGFICSTVSVDFVVEIDQPKKMHIGSEAL